MFRDIYRNSKKFRTNVSAQLHSATWSEYKHHNTLKFLVCTAPNSAITFASKAYTGRISDKEITTKCFQKKTKDILNENKRYSNL